VNLLGVHRSESGEVSAGRFELSRPGQPLNPTVVAVTIQAHIANAAEGAIFPLGNLLRWTRALVSCTLPANLIYGLSVWPAIIPLGRAPLPRTTVATAAAKAVSPVDTSVVFFAWGIEQDEQAVIKAGALDNSLFKLDFCSSRLLRDPPRLASSKQAARPLEGMLKVGRGRVFV